jgi:hypothetical protein
MLAGTPAPSAVSTYGIGRAVAAAAGAGLEVAPDAAAGPAVTFGRLAEDGALFASVATIVSAVRRGSSVRLVVVVPPVDRPHRSWLFSRVGAAGGWRRGAAGSLVPRVCAADGWRAGAADPAAGLLETTTTLGRWSAGGRAASTEAPDATAAGAMNGKEAASKRPPMTA